MDYSDLINRWKRTPELSSWADKLPQQIQKGFSHERFGDLRNWEVQLKSLPNISYNSISLDSNRVSAKTDIPLSNLETEKLQATLQKMHPWRKGPYELFGLHIDTEWRSDWKWDRLKNEIEPLQHKRVLDVGCGTGTLSMFASKAGAKVSRLPPLLFLLVLSWCLVVWLALAGPGGTPALCRLA